MPDEMIVNEYTVFRFVPLHPGQWVYYYPTPQPNIAFRPDSNILSLDTEWLTVLNKKVEFTEYGIGHESLYRVGLAPEINTVFVGYTPL